MRAVLLPLLFILSACAANIQVGDPAPPKFDSWRPDLGVSV